MEANTNKTFTILQVDAILLLYNPFLVDLKRTRFYDFIFGAISVNNGYVMAKNRVL